MPHPPIIFPTPIPHGRKNLRPPKSSSALPLEQILVLQCKCQASKSKLINSNGDGNGGIDDSGSSLSLVTVMVAECLLQRFSFDPIDSSTVLRRLDNDKNATIVVEVALQEAGGESSKILAV